MDFMLKAYETGTGIELGREEPMTEDNGVEVWRGGVNAWELDDMGHLNVRYYGARVVEGLVGLAAALGMPRAFAADGDSTIMIREQHIRFLREARSGAPLFMTGGVINIGDCEAQFLMQLWHANSGERAATYRLKVAHVTAGDGRPFAWSKRTLEAADRLMISTPSQAAPRSVGDEPVTTIASLQAAEQMGLTPAASGAFGAGDCDVFGRMRPELVIGRISDGMPNLMSGMRPPAPAQESGLPPRVGGAVLEYRLIHWDWPRAGDRFVVRSGVAGVAERAQTLLHWMLDPATGRPWATGEAVAISLDLGARKIVPYTPEHRAFLQSRIIPGLAL